MWEGFQISEFTRTRKAVVKFAGKITITPQNLESPSVCECLRDTQSNMQKQSDE